MYNSGAPITSVFFTTGIYYIFVDLSSYLSTGFGETCRVFKLIAYGSSSDFGDANLPTGIFHVFISSFAGGKSRIQTVFSSGSGIALEYVNSNSVRIRTSANCTLVIYLEPINY